MLQRESVNRRRPAMSWAAVAIVATLGASACSESLDVPSGAATPSVADLDGRTFLSTEVTGETLVPDTRVTVAFSESSVAVVAGCNTQTGGYSVDGDRLAVEALLQTLMACDEALTGQDAWLANLMQATPTISLAGDELTIASEDVTLVLVDRATSSANQLDGGTWIIDEIAGADGAVLTAPDGAHLSIDGESIAVATGCNRGVGSVSVTGQNTAEIGPLATTMMACSGDLGAWEQSLFTFLAGTIEYTVDGENLVLVNGDQTLSAHFVP